MPGMTIAPTGLLFVDSFDHLSAANLKQKWTSAGTTLVAGRTGYGATTGTSTSLYVTIGGNYATFLAGTAYKTQAFANYILQFAGSVPGSNVSVGLLHKGDGKIYVDLGDWPSAGAISTDTVFVMALNTWYFFEMSATIYPGTYGLPDSSIGYEVRVNNVTVLSGTKTGLTRNYAWVFQKLVMSGPGSGVNAYVDDVYLTDGTVGFLGDTTWGVIRPNAEGDESDFTPNSGLVHYDRVADILSDGDTTYLSSATVGDEELHNYEDIVATGPIVGAHFNLILKKSDSGSCTVRRLIKSGSSTDVDLDYFAPSETDYVDYRDGFLVSPFTGSAWTQAEINGLQHGLRRIT